MRDATQVAHAGLPAPSQGEPFLPGPTFVGPYHLRGDPACSPYTYGRYHNPTWICYERALGELEQGQAVAFASGTAAITAVMGSVLRPGDAVVMPSDGYYGARKLAQGFFAEMGVEVRMAPTAGGAQAQLLTGAKLLWLESPSNPGLDVCNIAALAAAAHEHGALVAVDNTTATVLGQRPLQLGADFSVASDTKALSGHGDLVLGHVAVRDPEWAQRLQYWRMQTGAIPGPMEVWLAHRSLATLDVRLERMCSNALAIAKFLATRPEVRRLRYPGLPEDAAHELASRQMDKYGSIMSFELEGREAAERFLNACELVVQATSFGGVHTTAERRARWGGDTVPDGFIRLSAGCEHLDDILSDLEQALRVAFSRGGNLRMMDMVKLVPRANSENVVLVERFYHQLWNRFDKGLIPVLLTEDIHFRGSLGQSKTGHDQFSEYVDFVRVAFPDFTNRIEEIVSEGDRSFARLTYSGTHKGELFGIAPTGRRVEYAGAALFRFRDGRIAEVWVLGDVNGLLQQLTGESATYLPQAKKSPESASVQAVRVSLYDAFTDQRFAGNVAGVVLDSANPKGTAP